MKHLVVVPAYNEEETLPGVVADLETLPEEFEVLIVDDGSRDQTAELAQDLAQAARHAVHVVHLRENCGIGVAVQTGYMFAAREGAYRFVIQFDADGQHAAAEVPALVGACEARGLDLCVGSRFLQRRERQFRSTLPRRLGNRLLSWLIGALSGVRVTDPTSGLRCAGPRAWRRFACHYPEDYPEPESLFWCARNRLRVGEVSVLMHPRRGGVSSLRAFRPTYYFLKVSLAILLDRLRAQEAWR
jgi:glycosyltransferase involved in cell wall biosynthesis